MKRFSWKLAIITFLVLIALNALLFFLDMRYPGYPILIGAARIVNFPSLAFLALFPVSASDYTSQIVMAAVLSSFSPLIWSVLVGFLLRRGNPLAQ